MKSLFTILLLVAIAMAVPVIKVPQLDCHKDLREQYRECVAGAEGPWDKVMWCVHHYFREESLRFVLNRLQSYRHRDVLCGTILVL